MVKLYMTCSGWSLVLVTLLWDNILFPIQCLVVRSQCGCVGCSALSSSSHKCSLGLRSEEAHSIFSTHSFLQIHCDVTPCVQDPAPPSSLQEGKSSLSMTTTGFSCQVINMARGILTEGVIYKRKRDAVFYFKASTLRQLDNKIRKKFTK